MPVETGKPPRPSGCGLAGFDEQGPEQLALRRGLCRPPVMEVPDVADRTCSVSDCERTVWSRGWCSMHYYRNWRNNDPEDRGPAQAKATPPAEDVSYHHVHVRLRAERGPASDRLCEDGCGRSAKHWAYDHSDPDALRSPEGFPYSTDLGNYWALCPSCHRRHDADVA